MRFSGWGGPLGGKPRRPEPPLQRRGRERGSPRERGLADRPSVAQDLPPPPAVGSGQLTLAHFVARLSDLPSHCFAPSL